MRVIGLTGGIASGKSTAARVLAELGARIIDADAIARDVVAPGQPALADDRAHLRPRDARSPTARSTASALGAVVFADAEQAARAQRHHPSAHRRRDAGAPRPRCAKRACAVAVYEAALLVENGAHHGLDGLIVVACDEATQLAPPHRARRLHRSRRARAHRRAGADRRQAARRRHGWLTRAAHWRRRRSSWHGCGRRSVRSDERARRTATATATATGRRRTTCRS